MNDYIYSVGKRRPRKGDWDLVYVNKITRVGVTWGVMDGFKPRPGEYRFVPGKRAVRVYYRELGKGKK